MSIPLLIGLTGSIGMGKSTAAQMFADHGFDVWDADASVHRLYSAGGAAVEPIRRLYPDAIDPSGAVDRTVLKRWISSDPKALGSIEEIVHPLVAADRKAFIAGSQSPAVVLDIPLLFETGAAAHMDLVVVVSTDPGTQRLRVLSRPGMTKEQFEVILAKQMPDAEKRLRADIIIQSDTLETAREGVQAALDWIASAKGTTHA